MNEMNIKKITPSICNDSFIPAIIFEIEIEYQEHMEVLLEVKGLVRSSDQKIVSDLKEAIFSDKKVSSRLGAKLDRQNNEKRNIKTQMISLFDKRVIEYLETTRKNNEKRDVILILDIFMTYLISNSRIAHIHYIEPSDVGYSPITLKDFEGSKLLLHKYSRDYYSHTSDQFIISGDGDRDFIKIEKLKVRKEIIIKSSDWVHDYSPLIGLGEYFIVEIPKGDIILEKAWTYIQKAEECFKQWDDKGAFVNCREIGVFLDKEIKKNTEKKSFDRNKWDRMYNHFNSYASMNLHVEDFCKKSGIDESTVFFDRNDVETLILKTKILIKYAENLINKN